MIKKGIHGYCLQETWLLGTFSKTIGGHLLLHHGMATKTCHRGRSIYGVTVDILSRKEFGVLRNGVVKTFQFIVEPLLVLVIHRVVDQGKEDLDPPLAPLVERVCYFIQAVQKTEGDANHPTWEVRVGR